jgi:hypothetical protein
MLVSELLKDVEKPPMGSIVAIPFASLQLIDWLGPGYINMAYASEPRTSHIFNRDCLANPPKYSGAYILSYPPWNRKNDSDDKSLFDKYNTDNLYKCFIKTLLADPPLGGTIVVPFSVFSGTRDSEIKRRTKFLQIYAIKQLHIYNETLINGFIPMVLTFIRRNEHPSRLAGLYPVFYPSLKKATWVIRDYLHLEDQDPFFETVIFSDFKPTLKKVQISVYQNTDIDTNPPLYFCKSETATSQISLSNENKEHDVRLKIRGFLSKRLQQRIIKDFNVWARFWINKTGGVFLKYICLKDKKQSYIPVELALIAIERLIWYYRIEKS